MIIILQVEETASRNGLFNGWINDEKIVSSSRTPFLTAARVLLRQRVNPTTILQMCRKSEMRDCCHDCGIKLMLKSGLSTKAGPMIDDELWEQIGMKYNDLLCKECTDERLKWFDNKKGDYVPIKWR